MTSKDVLPEKGLLEKAAALKRFEYSPLGKELKPQTSAADKQYQKLDKTFESNKNEEVIKKVVLSQIKSTIKILLFTNTTTLNNLLNVLFIQN